MTPKQIRDMSATTGNISLDGIRNVFLREIAAQLADQNELLLAMLDLKREKWLQSLPQAEREEVIARKLKGL
jgi:hypothetical protein